jgi:hypothetical protein
MPSRRPLWFSKDKIESFIDSSAGKLAGNENVRCDMRHNEIKRSGLTTHANEIAGPLVNPSQAVSS